MNDKDSQMEEFEQPHEELEEHKHRIMVVEDEKMLRGTITRYLKRIGYQVWGVANGFEALLLLQYHKPHLIISDIRMPQLGGLTMAEGMRNRLETRNIPIILITAYREESYFKRAKEVGAVYMLIKPFTLSELHQKVQSALKREEEKKRKTETINREDQSLNGF